MLFRKKDGTLIEININDFKNDYEYYKKIMITKSSMFELQENKNFTSYTKKILLYFLEYALNDCDNQENNEE
jgi:hypothetical protein